MKKYGGDDNPGKRYWVELAQGRSTSDWNEFAPETASNLADDDDEISSVTQNWEDFLKANDLDAEPAREQSTPAAASLTKSETIPLLIAENEVSLERLQQIFEASFFGSKTDGETLTVQMEGARFLLHLDETNKMIVCAAIYGLRKYAPCEEKNALVNTLNRSLIFVRFIIHDETTFVAQYALPHTQGLLPFHLVNTLRLMQRVLTQSVGR